MRWDERVSFKICNHRQCEDIYIFLLLCVQQEKQKASNIIAGKIMWEDGKEHTITLILLYWIQPNINISKWRVIRLQFTFAVLFQPDLSSPLCLSTFLWFTIRKQHYFLTAPLFIIIQFYKFWIQKWNFNIYRIHFFSKTRGKSHGNLSRSCQWFENILLINIIETLHKLKALAWNKLFCPLHRVKPCRKTYFLQLPPG